ncbi:MAG: hemolysin family protein [Oscillospiraceae bacterium]|jgi:putative hemolysin|nr:hemolysin family protein [Oscillospiraceae bacterium]
MDSSTVAMLAALVALVALSAYFSATETAFTSLNRIRLKTRADDGDKRAARTLALAADFDRLLSTLLIGNNIVNNVATTIGAVLFIQLIGSAKGPTVSATVLTVVILIFGEVTPKSLAKERPEAWAIVATPLLRVMAVLLTPVNFLFTQWKKLLRVLLRHQDDDGITEEELMGMVDQAETEGSLDQHESDLIRNAIEFNDMEVSEILTPRVDLEALADTATMEEAAAMYADSGFSRLPIYHDSIDNIIGVLHEKDFYAAYCRGVKRLSELKSSVLYTTETARISDLLRQLQQNKVHMAVVVDEYGGTQGIVTMEDIMEELVGEIWDEHDEVIEEFRKQSDGSYLVACSADLDDLYDLFDMKPSEEYDASSVSGWVMEEIGRVPDVGDRFQADGLDVCVTRVEHRRVMEIRVRPLPPEREEPEKAHAHSGT